ncbi:MAG: FGGY-family carbohydrate kinase [Thermoprotei archaeon]|nr:FGGY-family carbohydrate kinase [Thermoprotei archaeon]
MKYGVIDVGGTGVKVSVYNESFRKVDYVKIQVPIVSSKEGVAEHDALEIRGAVIHTLKWLRERGVKLGGIATYRASILAWHRDGTPLTNVITWMDWRSRAVVSKPIYKVLGLVPPLGRILRADSPAVKIKWLLESTPGIKARVERGEAYVGTLSSYIAYLVSSRYINDASNEALTGLLHPGNFKRLWPVYDILGIPKAVDPEVVDNVSHIGSTDGVDVGVLIADQQASIVGSSCLSPQCLKVTGSTGVFVDAVTGELIMPGKPLIPLVVYRVRGEALYAVEGFASSGGSIVEWLVRAGFLDSVGDLDRLAYEARHGVVFIPSLSPISYPVVRGEATGLVYGLSHSTSKSDFARGALEGVVLIVASLADRVEKTAGRRELIRADGGLSNSTAYLKLLASACNRRVERVRGVDGTGRGVALLLAVYEGALKTRDLAGLGDVDLTVEPGALSLKVNVDVWRRALGWGSRVS